MAKPRDTSSPNPLVGSEESEEEEETSEEEIEGSESESEPEPPQVNKKSTPAPVSKKSEPQPSKIQSADSSSDDDESDSETDSDSPIKKPDSSVKPIASKPMDDTPRTPNSKNSRSKSNPTGPAATVGAKRPSATSTARESKRPKKKSETDVDGSEDKGVPNDDSKKLFQRLWSEDDEIAILQGMIDYRAKKKADPTADLNDFHEFIKKSIHIDVSKTQLQDKIRRLKKKYRNNSSKENKGKYKVSSKPHEQSAYDLSKKVWGQEGIALSPKSNGTAVKGSKTKISAAPGTKVDEMEVTLKEDNELGGVKGKEGIRDTHIGIGDQILGNWIAEEGWKMMKGEKREEMEEKWKKLRKKEVEVFVEKMELQLEHAKIVLEAMNSK